MNAWGRLVSTMNSENITWSDVGNWIEQGDDGNKYTEAEMLEFAQAARVEGIKVGTKIGLARAGNSAGNGHITLPKPSEMAEFCNARLGRLDDKQRDFRWGHVSDHAAWTGAVAEAAGVPH